MIISQDMLSDKQSIFYRCVEGSYDAIMVTDVKGTILYVNHAFVEMYGYTREEVLGKNPRILRSGQQDKIFYETMWKDILVPNKGYWKGELVNRAKDETEVPVLLTITPFKDEEGITRGYMSVALDMREKKQMEAQLIHQDRLASIGLLASGMAHEIGTPLGVIRGRAEYLKINPEKVDLKSVEIIINQIDRISKLIYSLLNLARSGKSEIAVPVSVAKALSEAGNLVNQSLTRNSITFNASVSPEVIVKAEIDRLEQIFLNLFMNSIHAIETAIKNGRKEGHKILVNCVKNGQMWELKVMDTGCGISKENMKNIFKPFFTTKEVGSGTGLGLVICQQIIGSWSGKLLVESQEGTGTTFKLLLPKG